MSEFSGKAADAVREASAYVAALLRALDSRDPYQVLAGTPDLLQRTVDGLSPAQDGTPETSGKWSVRQVVQHLADSELVASFRFRMILAHDAPALPGYDQDLWAERLRYQSSDVATALHDFRVLRNANLRLLRRATPEDLLRVMRHSERGDEALGQLLAMHAGHDLVHVAQIRRIRDAIGAPGDAA
jgi:hypothetical protein